MEKKKTDEPRVYTHVELMNEFNNMSICVKTHLFDLGDQEFKTRHPKPTVEEWDRVFNKIWLTLRQYSQPVIKRKQTDEELMERDGPNYEADIDNEEW